MNQNEDPRHVSLSSENTESGGNHPPARLSGPNLEAWYQKYPTLSAEDRLRIEQTKATQYSANAATILLVNVTLLSLANFGLWVFGPLLISIVGMWLVIGQYNIFVRSGSALAAVLFLGFMHTKYMACLALCGVIAAILTYVGSILVSLLLRVPSRLARFSILELAGSMLAIGIAAALLRHEATQFFEQNSHSNGQLTLLIVMGAAAVNTVLASLAVLVPKPLRHGLLFGISAGLVLLVTPVVEALVIVALLGDNLLFVIIATIVMHGVAALLVWSIVFPLEIAGAFREPVTETMVVKVETGELEDME